jgi:hypothetical protein
MSNGAKMTGERSYSDLSDSATTFDPEEQFDRDIDERMNGMTKEEAVGEALRTECVALFGATWSYENAWRLASAAIAAADKWDAEEGNGAKASSSNAALEQIASVCSVNMDIACNHRMALDFVRQIASRSNISPGLNSAIQDELDHPPASIMEEGK